MRWATHTSAPYSKESYNPLNEFTIEIVSTSKENVIPRIILNLVVAAAIVIGLLNGAPAQAQTVSPALRFEVASVRLVQPDGKGSRSSGIPGPDNSDPGRFTARARLLILTTIAYDIPVYRVSDPDDSLIPMVDIEAKMPPDTTREQFNVMLQNLLADRFGLKVHWSTGQVDMYVLVVAKGGPKFKLAAPDSPQGTGDASKNSDTASVGPNGFPIPPPGNGSWIGAAPVGRMIMRGHNETAAEMARAIGARTLGGPLTDSTGLAGKYDYTVFWSMQATTAARVLTSVGEPADPDGPSIFDAVEEQLGLKIEKRRGPVQMLTIDHVAKNPTEN